MTTKTLALSTIHIDGDTQPRTKIDQDVVDDYAAAYGAKSKIPELDVFHDGTNWWLADGFHRYHAAKKAGLDKLPCHVHKGTKEDAQWFAVSANQTHGLRRSNADKAKAVKAALKHPKGVKMSDRQIAEYVGVSNNMVSDYRKRLSSDDSEPKRKGRDGRTTDTTNIGKGKPPKKCPKCGSTDFHKDGTCAVCISDPGEDTDVKPTDPGDPATILKCDIRDVVQLWHESVADADLMVAAAVLENCAEELRNEQ